MDLMVFVAVGLFVFPVVLVSVLAYGTKHILESSRSKRDKAMKVLGLVVLLLTAGLLGFRVLLLPFDGVH